MIRKAYTCTGCQLLHKDGVPAFGGAKKKKKTSLAHAQGGDACYHWNMCSPMHVPFMATRAAPALAQFRAVLIPCSILLPHNHQRTRFIHCPIRYALPFRPTIRSCKHCYACIRFEHGRFEKQAPQQTTVEAVWHVQILGALHSKKQHPCATWPRSRKRLVSMRVWKRTQANKPQALPWRTPFCIASRLMSILARCKSQFKACFTTTTTRKALPVNLSSR
jgi:hypothetical protein